MSDLLQGAGLLGVATPLGANVSLVVMLVAAVLFTIGWRLAVRKPVSYTHLTLPTIYSV